MVDVNDLPPALRRKVLAGVDVSPPSRRGNTRREAPGKGTTVWNCCTADCDWTHVGWSDKDTAQHARDTGHGRFAADVG
jgi:hypothetical protein